MTRYADDRLVQVISISSAVSALTAASRILEKLGVMRHSEKTRIVHVRQGLEFLGFQLKRGSQKLKLAPDLFVAVWRKANCMHILARNQSGTS